jgi:hypothetical protein
MGNSSGFAYALWPLVPKQLPHKQYNQGIYHPNFKTVVPAKKTGSVARHH